MEADGADSESELVKSNSAQLHPNTTHFLNLFSCRTALLNSVFIVRWPFSSRPRNRVISDPESIPASNPGLVVLQSPDPFPCMWPIHSLWSLLRLPFLPSKPVNFPAPPPCAMQATRTPLTLFSNLVPALVSRCFGHVTPPFDPTSSRFSCLTFTVILLYYLWPWPSIVSAHVLLMRLLLVSPICA